MTRLTAILASVAIAWGSTASAEILAMMNYESKTPDQLKSLKLSGVFARPTIRYPIGRPAPVTMLLMIRWSHPSWSRRRRP